MSIEDNYEINVAKKRNSDDQYGIHWCRIELGATSKEIAQEKLAFLKFIFGKNFNLTMTFWECRGHNVKENR